MPDSIIMVAQYPTAVKSRKEENKDMLTFAQVWAKQQLACAGPGCVVAFTSYDDFINKLKTGGHHARVVILVHSNSDALSFPQADTTDPSMASLALKDFEEIAAALGSTSLNDNYEFIGCLAGRDPARLWDFGVAINAKTVTATNFLHVMQPLSIDVKQNTTGDDVRNLLLNRAAYLVPGTDLDEVATHGGKSVQVWIEWFADINDATLKLAEVEGIDPQSKTLIKRSAVSKTQVFDRAEAVLLTSTFKQPSPLATEVRLFTGPASPP